MIQSPPPVPATEALVAIRDGRIDELRRLLGERPELAAARDGSGVSLLLSALYHRRPEAAELLVAERRRQDLGLDLCEAAATGDLEQIEARLAVDPEAVADWSADGFTPLHLAAFFASATAVARLLAAEADPAAAARNPLQVTPLHSAVAAGNDEAVEHLLAAGAPVDARQQNGFTPLMGAAAGGHAAIVRRLLAAGADPGLAADDGKTAAELARERGHGAITDQLAAAGR